MLIYLKLYIFLTRNSIKFRNFIIYNNTIDNYSQLNFKDEIQVLQINILLINIVLSDDKLKSLYIYIGIFHKHIIYDY